MKGSYRMKLVQLYLIWLLVNVWDTHLVKKKTVHFTLGCDILGWISVCQHSSLLPPPWSALRQAQGPTHCEALPATFINHNFQDLFLFKKFTSWYLSTAKLIFHNLFSSGCLLALHNLKKLSSDPFVFGLFSQLIWGKLCANGQWIACFWSFRVGH